ncbi:hypothetical protein V5O48_008929 [Marasmius crinis-equi]|uniref:DUF7726 domain-containing protein n=1 Tax=Marasmius crinis-equi TaxID=585013 RepID=A0ABR3FCL8_9AGAR
MRTKSAAKKARRTSGTAESTSPSPSEPDLFSISLRGDENETVPIFDSCDEIRSKIEDHFEETGMTKAAFLRDISRAAFPSASPPIKIQTKQLSDFSEMYGATTGNANRVYYAAYVYFEKKRLSEGTGKSEHRLRMEKEWGAKGVGRKLNHYRWVTARWDEEIVEDDVGRIRVIR